MVAAVYAKCFDWAIFWKLNSTRAGLKCLSICRISDLCLIAVKQWCEAAEQWCTDLSNGVDHQAPTHFFLFWLLINLSCKHMCVRKDSVTCFFKENIRYPVWTRWDPIFSDSGNPIIIFSNSKDPIFNSTDLNRVPETPEKKPWWYTVQGVPKICCQHGI